MAKRKGNRSKTTNKVVKSQDASVLLIEQKEALAGFRGRRASVLGERIYADQLVDELVRLRSLAAGNEAYLRELLLKGHVELTQGQKELYETVRSAMDSKVSAAESVEERVLQMQERKKGLIDGLLGDQKDVLKKWNEADLEDLFKPIG